MNILFTYVTPFHPQRGGIGRVTDSLTREFKRRGHNVYYLIYPSLLKPFGVNDTENFSFPAPLEFLPSKIIDSEVNRTFYNTYLLKNQINIVINQSGSGSDSALWLTATEQNIPVISCIHSFPLCRYEYMWEADVIHLRNDRFIEKAKRIARISLYQHTRKQYYKSEQLHYNFILPKTTKLCFLSPRFFDNLKRLKLTADYSDKLCAIPNPNSYPSSIEVSLQDKKKQLLYVGLMNNAKGSHRLIDIWKNLHKDFPDWEMIVVGKGEQATFDRIKRQAQNLPRIIFKGLQDPLPYFKDASLFCMTSNYEGWGMVLTEAMQFGTVPIAFNSFASVNDIINDGINGFLIKPFSLNDYCQKLRLLMTDSSKLETMAKAAIRDVRRFDVKNIANQWEQLFSSL